MLCVILYSQSGSKGWPRTGAITGLGAADPLQSNKRNSITNRFQKAALLLRPPAAENVLVIPQIPPSRTQRPHWWQASTTGGRAADTGLKAAQSLRVLGLREQRVVGSIPGWQSEILALWKKIWSSATGDDCACGADPTRIQPPSNTPFPTVDLQADPSFTVLWEDQTRSSCPQRRSHASYRSFLSLKVKKEKKKKKRTEGKFLSFRN